MQIRTVAYADFFHADVITPTMVTELASGLGLSKEYISKMQAQDLKKPSGSGRARTNGASNCPDAKLRTIVLKKLQEPNDIVSGFAAGASFEYEFQCFEDEKPAPDINSAGANNTRKPRANAPKSGSVQQQGAYTVLKRGLKCTVEQDPEKFNMWQHVWNSKTFEEYYANAPKKAVTRTGRIITAASEMAWAIKSGWVVPAK